MMGKNRVFVKTKKSTTKWGRRQTGGGVEMEANHTRNCVH
jgi:hypothetical protein